MNEPQLQRQKHSLQQGGTAQPRYTFRDVGVKNGRFQGLSFRPRAFEFAARGSKCLCLELCRCFVGLCGRGLKIPSGLALVGLADRLEQSL